MMQKLFFIRPAREPRPVLQARSGREKPYRCGVRAGNGATCARVKGELSGRATCNPGGTVEFIELHPRLWDEVLFFEFLKRRQ